MQRGLTTVESAGHRQSSQPVQSHCRTDGSHTVEPMSPRCFAAGLTTMETAEHTHPMQPVKQADSKFTAASCFRVRLTTTAPSIWLDWRKLLLLKVAVSRCSQTVKQSRIGLFCSGGSRQWRHRFGWTAGNRCC